MHADAPTGLRKAALKPGDVCLTEFRRDKEVGYLPASRFIRGPTEHLGSTKVPCCDASIAIHGDDCVVRGIEEEANIFRQLSRCYRGFVRCRLRHKLSWTFSEHSMGRDGFAACKGFPSDLSCRGRNGMVLICRADRTQFRHD